MSKRYGGRQPYAAPQHRLVARDHEILTRSPLLQAALQMDSGDPNVKGPRPSRWFWDGCPDLKPIPPNSVDLTGHRFGRMTVVGLLAKEAHGRSGKRAAWVCRCSCGAFETRTAKAIRENKAGADHACTQCEYVWHLRRRAAFDRTGVWPDNTGGRPAG